MPLAASPSGGNRNDVTRLPPLPGKVPSVTGLVGRPRRRPDVPFADQGYDHDKYRRPVWDRGIEPMIARRGVPHGPGLGVRRWAVERTIARLHGFRRPRAHAPTRPRVHASTGNDARTADAGPGKVRWRPGRSARRRAGRWPRRRRARGRPAR
ncbi:hypothetical protein ACFY84_34165 [Streptomyces sp. NPDC012438]|uniref:hypothetical protein n=1 Tax=Streptomyces sp. NPDC012438 TaxID=3364833 RepID=UPI0036EB23A7